MSRVVLVTGSTSGIGEETALRFAALGDHVIFNSVRSVEAGEALSAKTPGSFYIQGDISNDADCERMIEMVLERYGRLDVLVNNAGATKVIAHADINAATANVELTADQIARLNASPVGTGSVFPDDED